MRETDKESSSHSSTEEVWGRCIMWPSWSTFTPLSISSRFLNKILIYLFTHFAAGMLVGHRIVDRISLSRADSLNVIPSDFNFPKKHCLFSEKVSHLSKKCNSVSGVLLSQYLHIL